MFNDDPRVDWRSCCDCVVDDYWYVMYENGRWNIYSPAGVYRIHGSGVEDAEDAIAAAKGVRVEAAA